jgi:hypothetical protein
VFKEKPVKTKSVRERVQLALIAITLFFAAMWMTANASPSGSLAWVTRGMVIAVFIAYATDKKKNWKAIGLSLFYIVVVLIQLIQGDIALPF